MRNRKFSIWMFGLLLVLALTLGACAEAGQNEPGDNVGIVEPETTAVLTEDVTMDDEAPLATEGAVLPATGSDNLARLEAVDGLTVQTAAGEMVGEVEDTIINLNEQRVSYLVVDADDTLNMADPNMQILVPFEAVNYQSEVMAEMTAADAHLTMADNLALETIMAAPAIAENDFAAYFGENWTPEWDLDFRNYWDPVLTDLGVQTPMVAASSMDANLTGALRTEDLLGFDVQGQNGEIIGEIEAIAVDLANGKIPFVVITGDELFGIGGKDVALPLQTLSGAPQNEALSVAIPLDDATFENMPDFELETLTNDTFIFFDREFGEAWNDFWAETLDLTTP